ncbi:359_t:CDS:2, partial [Gigaspora margarita]
EYDEDIDIFNSRLLSYLAGTGIDPVANRDQAFAGMGTLRGHTMAQMNTSNSFRNPSIAHDYANVVGNNAVTVSNSMIPAEGEFYSKLLKYGKMLNLDEQKIKGQFLRGLFSDLKDDAERIGTEQLLADLFKILERIEIRRAEKKLGLVSKIPQSSYKSSSKLIPAQESKTQHF